MFAILFSSYQWNAFKSPENISNQRLTTTDYMHEKQYKYIKK